jgi:hypothetical protein
MIIELMPVLAIILVPVVVFLSKKFEWKIPDFL